LEPTLTKSASFAGASRRRLAGQQYYERLLRKYSIS